MKRTTEEEYREAAKIWRIQNPNDEGIHLRTVIKLPNGKIINLGNHVNYIRNYRVKLTEEQVEFWDEFGVFNKKKATLKTKSGSIKITKKGESLIVAIVTKISKKYNISLSNLLFMFETVREYELLDVGLEEKYENKIDKIKKYHLEEYEVEDSYFLALEFKKKVLNKKSKELFQRYELLRQYIIDWNYYSEIEKKQEIKRQNFTKVELDFINESREELDCLIRSLEMKQT